MRSGATEGKATDEESPRLPTRLPHGRISKSHRPSFEYTHHILNTQASRNGISDRLLDDGRYSGQGFTRGGSRSYYITCRSPAARWLAHVRLPFARLTPAYRSLGRSVGRSVGWPYRILPCSSTRHGPGAVEGTRAVSTDDARAKGDWSTRKQHAHLTKRLDDALFHVPAVCCCRTARRRRTLLDDDEAGSPTMTEKW